jgi:hypothetical protein
MKKVLCTSLVALTFLAATPRSAAADITFFVGLSPKPEMRSLRGVSAGINMLIVGFEFDYAVIREDAPNGRPGMQTGMFNMLVMTPTNTQLYVTAGAGLYRETLAGGSETNVGTNVGGGIKISLFGPIKVRVDYRVFALRGHPTYSKPQRLYVGINWAF